MPTNEQHLMEPILVEGFPGSGKTTLIENLSKRLGASNCQGFFTREIRPGRTRTGFAWHTFDGRNGVLADLQSGQPRVGKYRVDLSSFDQMLNALSSPVYNKVLLIDEVGKMECLSEKFRKLLGVWEKADCPRVFTVAARGTPVIEEFKSRNQSRLFQITPANREELVARIAKSLS